MKFHLLLTRTGISNKAQQKNWRFLMIHLGAHYSLSGIGYEQEHSNQQQDSRSEVSLDAELRRCFRESELINRCRIGLRILREKRGHASGPHEMRKGSVQVPFFRTILRHCMDVIRQKRSFSFKPASESSSDPNSAGLMNSEELDAKVCVRNPHTAHFSPGRRSLRARRFAQFPIGP